MKKILLALDSDLEKKFLDRLVSKLGFRVISIEKGKSVGAELIENFPDVVFTSSIGKESKAIYAVVKLRRLKGVPKVIFLRKDGDRKALTEEQKTVVDSELYSPIEPFRLIEALHETTGVSLESLKERYRDWVVREGGEVPSGGPNPREDRQGIIHDQERGKRYQEICKILKKKNEDHGHFDVKKFRDLQKKLAKKKNISEDHEELRKSFVTSLFSMKKTS